MLEWRWSKLESIIPFKCRLGAESTAQQGFCSSLRIPLRPLAFEVLVNKLKGNVPKFSNAGFNEAIKEVCKKAELTDLIKFSYKRGNKTIEEVRPKYAWIISHTCRRSFCTNEFLANTPVELIMKISGHKSLKDFYRYIKVTPEQAANQIEKIWKERESMIAVA